MLIALSGILAIVCLFVPFVWMEVGPLGHQYYGPTVPDVYIYGGTITGKDMRFWGISFAATFQLVFNLLFIAFSLIAFFLKEKAAVIVLLFIQSLLLGLFPLWLEGYISGVIGNSDVADLTIHYEPGMVFYYSLIGLNVLELILVFRTKRFMQKVPSDI